MRAPEHVAETLLAGRACLDGLKLSLPEGWEADPVAALAASGVDEDRLLRVLAVALSSSEETEARAAVLLLGAIGRPAAPVLGQLIERTRASTGAARWEAAWVFAQIAGRSAGEMPNDVMASLFESLSHPLPEPVADLLVRAFDHKEAAVVRVATLRSLMRTGPAATRRAVLELAGRQREPCEDLAQILLECSRADVPSVRAGAAYAFAEITWDDRGAELAVDTLVNLLEDDTEEVRLVAIGGLGRRAIPDGDRDRVARALAPVLARSGPEPENACWVLSQHPAVAALLMREVVDAASREVSSWPAMALSRSLEVTGGRERLRAILADLGEGEQRHLERAPREAATRADDAQTKRAIEDLLRQLPGA